MDWISLTPSFPLSLFLIRSWLVSHCRLTKGGKQNLRFYGWGRLGLFGTRSTPPCSQLAGRQLARPNPVSLTDWATVTVNKKWGFKMAPVNHITSSTTHSSKKCSLGLYNLYLWKAGIPLHPHFWFLAVMLICKVIIWAQDGKARSGFSFPFLFLFCFMLHICVCMAVGLCRPSFPFPCAWKNGPEKQKRVDKKGKMRERERENPQTAPGSKGSRTKITVLVL